MGFVEKKCIYYKKVLLMFISLLQTGVAYIDNIICLYFEKLCSTSSGDVIGYYI